MSTEPTIAATPTPVPAAPRPLTPVARRQAWREASVRRWVVATVGIAIVVAAVGVRAANAGRAERRLQAEGVRVDARVEQLYGQGREADRSVARPVLLSFTLPGNAEPTQAGGTTTPMAGRLAVGQTIPIYVDPRDANRWTDRVDPRPWAGVLAAPLLLSPLILVLGALAWRARSRVLRVWRDGAAGRATVLDVQTSALVPGQKVLRVALPAGGNATLTHPDRVGPRARGEAVDIVADGDRAVSAAAYVWTRPG